MTRRSLSFSLALALAFTLLSSIARAQPAANPDGGAPPPPATPDEAEIEKALKADVAAQQKSQPAAATPQAATPAAVAPPPSTPAQPTAGGWASFGRFIQSMNPDLSAIVDFAAGWYSDDQGTHKSGDDPAKTGFNVQEVEVALQAVVDPYFRADLFLTIPNLGGLEVEEAYLTTTHLPFNLQLRAGIFRAPLGRQNTQHLHMQDFTRRPGINYALLGVDGLRAPGMELNWLVPRVPFFLTLSFSMFSVGPADPDAPLQTFGGGKPWDFTYVANARAFFNTSQNTSLYVGLNYAHGKTSQHATQNCLIPTIAGGICATAFDNWYDNLYGADLYFKWKPPNVAQHYRSVAWTTEWFMRQIPDLKILGVGHAQLEGGLYTQVVVQLARRWLVGLRGEALGVPKGDNLRTELAAAGSVTWTLSEFSRIRLYAEVRGPVGCAAPPLGCATPNAQFVSAPQPQHVTGALFTQFEIAIGAHGAHPF
ncbi:MAG TPA: hypothetical protein VFF06_01445 [Polyangia bacterium]|nr:hypothetical protein [Polyangia bacterium]